MKHNTICLRQNTKPVEERENISPLTLFWCSESSQQLNPKNVTFMLISVILNYGFRIIGLKLQTKENKNKDNFHCLGKVNF